MVWAGLLMNGTTRMLLQSTAAKSAGISITLPRGFGIQPLKSYQGQRTEYLPTKWREAFRMSTGFVMGGLFTRDLSLVRTHSYLNAPLATNKSAFPVVVIRSGGSALAIELTSLAEELASHGYVVVGFDAPYRSFITVGSDDRVIHRSPAASLEEGDPQALRAQAEKAVADVGGGCAFRGGST